MSAIRWPEIDEPRREEFSRISASRAAWARAFISASTSSVCGCSESATQKPLRKVSLGRSSIGASSLPGSAQLVGAFSRSTGRPVVEGRRGEACQRAVPIFMWWAASTLTRRSEWHHCSHTWVGLGSGLGLGLG